MSRIHVAKGIHPNDEWLYIINDNDVVVLLNRQFRRRISHQAFKIVLRLDNQRR